MRSSAAVALLVLVLGCLVQEMAARSLVADLLILKFIGNIIKPRFVPLPVPLPLPIKFTKHTHKPYAVPMHGHSFPDHHFDPSPLSFHLGGGYDGLMGHDFSMLGHHHDELSSFAHDHHQLAALASLDHAGHDFSSLASIDHGFHPGLLDLSSVPTSSQGHYQLTHLPDLPHGGQLAVAELPSKYAAASHLTPHDRHVIQSLVDAAELVRVPSTRHQLHLATAHDGAHDGGALVSYDDSSEDGPSDSHHLLLSAANDEVLQNLAHASEMSYVGGHDHEDSANADIDAVGGFDFLTDLHDVGVDQEWWKK